MKKKNSSKSTNQSKPKGISPSPELSVTALKSAFLGEMIDTRHANKISQKKLQATCGVQQAVIARMELGDTDPKLTTIIRVLRAQNMRLAIIPLNTKYHSSR